MRTVKADFLHFLATGHLGPLAIGSSWSSVEATLGACEDYGVGRWGMAYGSYGCIEFTARDGEVLVIKLLLSAATDDGLPAALEMTNFENPQLSIAETRRILDGAGVTWSRVASLCDHRTTYYQTSTGVHVIFEDGKIATVCAQAMFEGMIE